MRRSKKITAVLLVLCMSFVFTGCGKKDSGSAGSDCAYYCQGAGFGFDLPDGIKFSKGRVEMTDLGDVDYDSGVMVGWPVYYDMTEDEERASIEQGTGQLHAGHIFTIACVKDVNSEEEAKEKMIAAIDQMMGGISEEDEQDIHTYKMIHQENGYVWLEKADPRADDIREESTEEYNTFYDASDEIISNLKFYTPEVWTGTEEGTALSFETIDLDQNPVKSESLFSQNKVTMINIWSTTCGPCIEEMPELEKLNKEFQAKGGAIVGLVDDVWVSNTKYLDEAKSIVKDTGVTYTNLCAWEGYDDMLEAVGTPTTYFVDSQGKLIGDPILGAHPDKYIELMDKYLSMAE